MSDVFDGFYSYDPDDPDNPFFGLDGFDRYTNDPDPFEEIEREVFGALDIEDFGGLLVRAGDVDSGSIRGNRFGDIREAILYLADAGLLQFGQVVLFPNGEIGVAIGTSP